MWHFLPKGNDKPNPLITCVSQRAKEHSLFEAILSNDKRTEESSDSEHEVEQKDRGLAQAIVPIFLVYLGYDILQRVESGEHDEEDNSEEGHSLSLLPVCQF